MDWEVALLALGGVLQYTSLRAIDTQENPKKSFDRLDFLKEFKRKVLNVSPKLENISESVTARPSMARSPSADDGV